MSVQAYQRAARRADAPRTTEYRLLGQVTRALLDVDRTDAKEIGKLAEALDWNRRVWSAFATDCASAENKLPDNLKAGIISLSIFVSKHSSEVMREGGEIDVLVDINRAIMQGLETAANAPAA